MGRNKSPSENTVRILCGKAAGMCEFEGCNKRLFYDGVTLSTSNNAYVAHIVASSSKGPRGDKTLSPLLSDKLENLMLMCADHHKLIDIKRSGDTFIIANPVMPEENFADKWNENPEKAREFFRWLELAKTAILIAPINAQGLHKASEALEVCFGRNIVRRSLVDDGHDTKIARESKTLYVDGLTGGLKTTPSQTTKKVGGHTFFGK